MTDPAAQYEALRRSTAEMLNLADAVDLSPADALRIDLASLLRLQVDRLTGLALAGRDADVATLNTCVMLLQKLLPQTQLSASSAALDIVGAKSELMDMLNSRHDAIQAAEAREAERLSGLDIISFCDELIGLADNGRLVIGSNIAAVFKARVVALKTESMRPRIVAPSVSPPSLPEPEKPPAPPWGAPRAEEAVRQRGGWGTW